MWLVNVEHVWDGLPHDKVRGAEFAIRLLNRTQELLQDGRYWRDRCLAYTWDGTPCNPLHRRAYHFNLLGAAARARWEMREDLAAAEINPAHIRQMMEVLCAVSRDYRAGLGGWSFANAILDGLRAALEQYQWTQKLEEKRKGPEMSLTMPLEVAGSRQTGAST